MSHELKKDNWGKLPSGEPIDLYTLRNANGIETTITNYGGRVVTLKTPDRQGRLEDIVLGCDKLDGYLAKNPYLGALVGRYANRIANAEFTLRSKTYYLARNDGPNSLHGGLKGFDKVAWKSKPVSVNEGPAVELTYLSPDGEENYPGNLNVTVRYTLTGNNELKIDYHATTDKETILNLTNHSYFNLSGQSAGSILDHLVTINADEFTPVNENLIPTGERRRVSGTPFDFRKLEAIGKRIGENDQQLKYGIGYDHNYILNRMHSALVPAARVTEPNTGRTIEVSTTEPGIQFYTGNHLDGSVRGKGGTVYGFRSGFCLETQHFPDSPHHPEFPSTALKPGQEYRSTTVFAFSIE
jgi:aldose 1-epimerase